ncbi:acyltransferase family protein [Pseudomonas sp. PMCC200344]|uniref:acyltransferase family protein n=1 Tax=Pseudomonas sp. PMCC200344 TaxID=3042028 RepID=UPI0024B36937|nr:acyltransferase family protein [Pseudomonas sp. PMCC200344]
MKPKSATQVPLTSATAKNHGKFSLDINGLRAWAVVAVILFHFKIPGFTGGFAGVDIFFVISGLLMTKIIIENLEQKKYKNKIFLLCDFYFSRMKRILPTLLALCFSLIVIGWFCLGPVEYITLGKHVTSAVLFFSNIEFQQEAGYFDSASHEKWLLHTWSLAVEWQFYLVFPLVLLAAWKSRPGRLPITLIIAVTFIASFGASMYYTTVQPTKAFYFLPTRVWEMLAGSLVFLLGARLQLSSRNNRIIEFTGLLLIILSIFVFDENTAWPGSYAMVPVSGTALVLLAARQDSLFTSNALAQWLGTRSYSLYLWHWPVVVGLYFLEYLDLLAALVGISITIILGHFSYHFIERKSQKALTAFSPTISTTILIIAVSAPVMIGKAVIANEGSPARLPEKYVQILKEAQNMHPRRGECHVGGMMKTPECTYGGDQLGVIVIGDSHAASIMTAVENALPDKRLNVLHWTFSACPTFMGVKQPNTACADFVSWALEKQKALPSNVPVIIMNETSAYVHGFSEGQKPTVYFKKQYDERSPKYLQELRESLIDAACEIAKHHPVFIVRPIPEMKSSVPATTARAFLLGKTSGTSISLEEYHKRNDFAWEAQDAARQKCNIKILDPLPYLCHDGRCYGSQGDWPIYYDDNHLSERGSRIISPLFREVFKNLSITQKPL